MGELVRQNRHIAFIARHGGGAAEAGFLRHPDGVAGRLIESLVTAVRNHGTGCSHEGIEAVASHHRPEIGRCDNLWKT